MPFAPLLATILLTQSGRVQFDGFPVRVLGNPGHYSGFEVLLDGGRKEDLLLCDRGLIQAGTVARTQYRITLSGLRAPGVRFDPGSTITIAKSGFADISVSFSLRLDGFDVPRWQGSAGKAPFHFLCLNMPEAECWHQQGWLNATPLSDPFPLLQDTHVGTPEISSYKFDRRWSNIIPLGAQAVPVIGLWSPSHRLYKGLNFQLSRQRSSAESDVCTAYHWGGPEEGSQGLPAEQFVCLAFPYGGVGYQGLAYPNAGATLQGEAELLISATLGPEQDPNEIFYQQVWNPANLPTAVPKTVDLSWLPGGIRLKDFIPPSTNLLSGPEKPFMSHDATEISGWGWEYENPVLVAAKNHDAPTLKRFRSIAASLRRRAKHFNVAGDECIFWTKPLTGSWVPEWGGAGVKTLHNANGFTAGRLFLGLYEVDHDQADWAIVRGVLNWAKHIAWTRVELADVPSSPFAIGGVLPTAFCLDCYAALRYDKDNKSLARECLQLARTFTYRYMIMWLSDNNHYDNLDSSFLWEPNSGRDWTGAACANELFLCLDSLAETAVLTGDPVFRWALQGSLSRWYQLYQDKYKPTLADYDGADMGEGYGLFPGNIYGFGQHSDHGFASSLAVIEPIGNSTVRVLVGPGAAMAFGKNGSDPAIDRFHFRSATQFSFIVHAAKGPFDLTVTAPFSDLSAVPISLAGPGGLTPVPSGRIVRPAENPWSVQILGVLPGQRIVFGAADTKGPDFPAGPPAQSPNPFDFPFTAVDFKRDAIADRDWSNLDSWAALTRTQLWTYGVHFKLGPDGGADFASNPFAYRLTPNPTPHPVSGKRVLAILFNPGSTYPTITRDDGQRIPISPDQCVLAWKAWPPIYHAKLLAALVDLGTKDARLVDPGGSQVWAMSESVSYPSSAELLPAWAGGIADYATERLQQARYDNLAAFGAASPGATISVLPLEFSGTMSNAAYRAQISSHLKAISPSDLVKGGLEPASQVAIETSGEDYLATLNSPGDAAAAVTKFVDDGHTLILAASGPYPMCYANSDDGKTADPLPPKLGLPIEIPFPSMPSGGVTMLLNQNQDVLDLGSDVPTSFPMPGSDPRLRVINPSQIPAGSKYTPIVSAVGADGKRYGDAAGLLELPSGGKILYVWSGLTLDEKNGDRFAIAIWKYALEQSRAGR